MSNTSRIGICTAGLAALSVLTACGSDDATSSPAGGKVSAAASSPSGPASTPVTPAKPAGGNDPCAILEPARVAKIVGTPLPVVKPARLRRGPAVLTSCGYASADLGDPVAKPPFTTVSVTLSTVKDVATMDQLYDHTADRPGAEYLAADFGRPAHYLPQTDDADGAVKRGLVIVRMTGFTMVSVEVTVLGDGGEFLRSDRTGSVALAQAVAEAF